MIMIKIMIIMYCIHLQNSPRTNKNIKRDSYMKDTFATL